MSVASEISASASQRCVRRVARRGPRRCLGLDILPGRWILEALEALEALESFDGSDAGHG